MTDEFSSTDETTRDDRDWIAICSEGDATTARLVCTYLEAERIEARVEARNARFLVEVPEEFYDAAMRIYGNEEMDRETDTAALQEVSHPTSIKTARRMREALTARGIAITAPVPGVAPRRGTGPGTLLWVFLITLLLAAAAVGLLMLLTRR